LALGLTSACGDDDTSGAGAFCPASTVECVHDRAGRACPADGTGWVAFSCGQGESCSEGACVSVEGSTCTAGTKECVSETLARACSADGTQWAAQACGTGQTCEAGVCTGTFCEPKARICATATAYKTCDDEGSGWVATECPGGTVCEQGNCIAGGACQPGTGICEDATTLSQCKADGSGYEPVTCPATAPCKDGKCQGTVCAVGETRCDSGMVWDLFGNPYVLLTCVDGTRWEQTACDVGSVCAYDNLDRSIWEPWAEAVFNWYEGGYYYSQPRPVLEVPPGATASCQVAVCNSIEMSAIFGGSGSVTCGDPDDSSSPAGDSVSYCRGLPPAVAPHWENLKCAAPYKCDPSDPWDGCDANCRPDQTVCTSGGLMTCKADGTWGAPVPCSTNGTKLCRMQSTGFGEEGKCMDAVCAEYWYDYWWGYGQQWPSESGTCTTDGKVQTCGLDGTLKPAMSCASGTCSAYSTVLYGGAAPGSCSAGGCTSGEQYCWYSDGNGTQYDDCSGGSWSTKNCAAGTACYSTYNNTIKCAQCAPEKRRCSPTVSGQIEYCTADWTWGAPQACPVGSTCSGNSCVKTGS
jgi:hypothetical protein